MKKIQILLIAIVFLGLSSCEDDFLTVNPSAALPPEVALQSVDDMQTILTGVYSQMQSANWYGRYFVLVPDVMTDDVKQNASANRAKDWAEYSGTRFDGIASGMWSTLYTGVLRANTIINATIEVPAAAQDRANQLLGEAYAVRALAHFDLVRLYAQHYGFTGDNSHPGIPIVLEFDQNNEPTRSTVAQVYAQIESDFTQAISLMNESRGKGFFSVEAAQAIMARIKLYQGDYSAAESMASTVINSPNTGLTSADNYISTWQADGFSPDAIFDVVMLETDNQGANALGRMYVVDGYGDYLPSQDLVSIIEGRGDDVRMGFFLEDNETLGGVFGNLRMDKFPSLVGADNTPVVRLAEMYLIRAEARARTGNEAGAIEDLMTIRSRAWASAPMVTASGQALLDEIEEEKRIELSYEGHRLWELMRMQRDVVRNDCTAPAEACTITYPSDRFVIAIPDDEINANPNMTQNTGY
ncbi:MAG: RagB/SusD family nutrient uptake outer membrane protein [Bacteroidota bacterium]